MHAKGAVDDAIAIRKTNLRATEGRTANAFPTFVATFNPYYGLKTSLVNRVPKDTLLKLS